VHKVNTRKKNQRKLERKAKMGKEKQTWGKKKTLQTERGQKGRRDKKLVKTKNGPEYCKTASWGKKTRGNSMGIEQRPSKPKNGAKKKRRQGGLGNRIWSSPQGDQFENPVHPQKGREL